MVALLARTVLASSLALAAQAVSGPRPLAGTYWKAIELAGKPVPSQDSIRGVYLILEERGRVYGSDGCNRVVGTYKLEKTSIRFSQMAATRMACIDAGNIDVAFQDALKSARQLTIAGEQLALFDSANRGVAMFVAVSRQAADPEKR